MLLRMKNKWLLRLVNAQCTKINISRGYCKHSFKGLNLSITDEVKEALDGTKKKPVVALDTTVLSRTLEYPDNVVLAKSVCDTIRSFGAIPAPIGILDGKVTVGLSDEELDSLGQLERYSDEASRRDLSLVVSRKGTCRTTLSSTLAVSEILGLKVAMTGSLNGVLRNINLDEDLSINSEIPELGKTPVAVVCCGFGPTVSVDNTIQYLSTTSVPTITWGPTKDFPVIGCRHSGGGQSMANFEDIDGISALINSHFGLSLSNGMVVAVPATEEECLDFETLDNSLTQAVVEADAEEICQQELRKFLSLRVLEIANFPPSLIQSMYLKNAEIASKIAVRVSELDCNDKVI